MWYLLLYLQKLYNMKAVIYARVSSTDDSQSYERQIYDLKRWAVLLKLDVIEVYSEKISAHKKGLNERVAFNNMLEYIYKNDIKHIMISELSRLSRRYIDTVNFIADCTKRGIAIHIQKEGLSTINDKGEENLIVKMTTAILSNFSEHEVQLLGHRIKSGKEFAAKNGGGFNQKIYGYDKGEDGKPRINEQQAVLVKKMFEMLLDGTGTRTIANYLNENYETKRWTTASVHSIVTNSFFCGIRKYNKLKIEVPAIISKEVFDEAQDFISNRKRFVGGVGTNVNPFASFIKCQCGATMNQIIIKSHNTDLYRCAKKCGVKSVNRPFLIREVKLVVERNASLTKDSTVRDRLAQKIETNKANIITNEKEIRSTKMMSDANYKRYLSGKMNEKKYEKFDEEFDVKIIKLTDDIKHLKEVNTALENSLKGKLLHYSDDLTTFKSQILKSIEFIEIKEEIAIVKIKGWAKVIIMIYRGNNLFSYNKYLKKNLNTEGFTTLDWNILPESDFSEEVEIA
jgi:site-specific DNA recombinase